MSGRGYGLSTSSYIGLPRLGHTGRGLHSSTFRLNLSHFVTITTLRIKQKVLRWRRIVDGGKSLRVGASPGRAALLSDAPWAPRPAPPSPASSRGVTGGGVASGGMTGGGAASGGVTGGGAASGGVTGGGAASGGVTGGAPPRPSLPSPAPGAATAWTPEVRREPTFAAGRRRQRRGGD